MRPLSAVLRRIRRFALVHRRALAAVCAALAAATALQAGSRPAPARTPVLVAAHDLPPGATVTAEDLTMRGFAPASVPAGTLRSPRAALGRTTVGPVLAGEPLTNVRLLGHRLLDRYSGKVAVPVRIGDAATVDLLRVGDHVDVLATDPQGDGNARTVARAAPVIAVPPVRRDAAGLASGALVVLAVSVTTARALSGAGVTSFLSVVLVR